MDFSKASSLLTQRRLSRRRAVQQGAAGLAAAGMSAAGLNAAAAQDGTPETGDPDHKFEFLFVQSFQGGSIAARDAAEGEYTVTLEHGLGQTIFFSNRPDRIVGAEPTGQFLERFNFSENNPPNAAILFEAEEGVDIAVVELTNPVYDEASSTATYDLKVIENFDNFDTQFHETAADLESVATNFGATHLLIDGCPPLLEVYCKHQDDWGRTVDTDGQRDMGILDICAYWTPPVSTCMPCDIDSVAPQCFDLFPDFCNEITPCGLDWEGHQYPD